MLKEENIQAYENPTKENQTSPWESSMLSNINNTENNWWSHACLILWKRRELFPEKRWKKNEDVEQVWHIWQSPTNTRPRLSHFKMGATSFPAFPPQFSRQHPQDMLKGFYRTAIEKQQINKNIVICNRNNSLHKMQINCLKMLLGYLIGIITTVSIHTTSSST